MLDNLTIKGFTRTVLRCNCPEEVFNKIVCEDNIGIDKQLSVLHKINIGDRLLIYVSMLHQTSELDSELSKLIDSGEKERNDKGFNRFRLVLVSDNPNAIQDEAFKSFERLGKDEKIHLHIINKNDLPT